MAQMTVCQTCGHEGYSNLLIHCEECQIVAVHRYCVDGPPAIDDEEINWHCEECVPRATRPVSPLTKSDRISSKVARKRLRSPRSRKKRKNNWGRQEPEKVDHVRERAAKVTADTSGLDQNSKDGILDSQQAKLKENISNKDFSEVEKNVGLEISKEEDHVHEKKAENPLEELHSFRGSRAAEQLNSAKGRKSEEGEEVLVDSVLCPTSERPRFIEDVGEDVSCMSSNTPPPRSNSHDVAQPSPTKAVDYVPTPSAPIKPDYNVLSRSSSVNLDNHILTQMPIVNFDNHGPAQPLFDTIWRGYCRISSDLHPKSFGLQAHLSNKANLKVHGAASALPNLIDFELLPKRYAWPKSFERSPPTGDVIGLYFLPVCERDEIFYDNLLREMIDRGLVLKSQINNVELLAFSSRELPLEEWRFQRKHYIWGVFKPKPETFMPSKSHADFPIDTRCQKQKNRALVSHSSTGSSTMINSTNSRILTHPKPAYSKQGYNSLPEYTQLNDRLNRRNHHQTSEKFHRSEPKFDDRVHGIRKNTDEVRNCYNGACKRKRDMPMKNYYSKGEHNRNYVYHPGFDGRAYDNGAYKRRWGGPMKEDCDF